MKLSEEAISEFKIIYWREYGKKISDEKAQEMGQNLLSLFKIVYRPIPEEEKDKTKYSDSLSV